MNIDKKKFALTILGLLGLILSIKLACIYYVANYKVYALSSFCSINEFIDCDGAAKSTTAQFWGIPLAYWGIFFYLIILFLTVVGKLKKIKFLGFLEVFKNPLAYMTTLGTIAFVCSMILAGISLFQIHKLCILCFITYFIDLVIALTASGCKPKVFLVSFKDTILDFIDGAKKYPKTFVTLLVLFVSFVCYTGITYNFVPHIKVQKSIMKYRDMKYNPYRVKGNILGAEKPEVVIELYSDYVCPLCYIHNIMLHQAVKEFSNVKVIHHNYPFDKECNPYITVNMHPGACFMSKGALAARLQGNYWEMSSLLYENQPKNLEELLVLARQLGFDEQKFIKDFNSEEIDKELRKELDDANKIGLDATPTMIVNGVRIVGVKPYYKLKDILIDHGAKPRK